MHTDMLHALAKARHDDLLETHLARGQPKLRRTGGQLQLLSRARRRLGSVLIRAGARLVEDGPPELDPLGGSFT